MKLKKIAIIVVIILAFVGLYSVSSSLVRNTGVSSSDIVYKNKKEEKVKAPEIDDGFYRKVSKLYDTENLATRKVDYLGDNYDYYAGVFDYIESNASSIFKEIGSNFKEPDEISNSQIYRYGEDINFEDFNDYDYVGVVSDFRIVDMFDDTSIVYAYKYPESKDLLVVYDYSDVKLNLDGTKLYDFGQMDSVGFYTKATKLKKYENFSILFVKGVSVV